MKRNKRLKKIAKEINHVVAIWKDTSGNMITEDVTKNYQ